MNEVTQIHLGRQAFTIAADAHASLRAYLKAIEKAVGDKNVVEEVELRMAELLAEHGISGEKVILPEDVDFLKSQLGDPKDFSDDTDVESPATTESGQKRLFRDMDNAIIGGVAAGLAGYFGIDAVIFRVLFVVTTIFGGGIGAAIYIVLWLIVPPANTTSEKLQMRGLPVTLEALKESVSNADIPGKAKNLNRTVSTVINTLFRIVLKLIGIGFILTGISVILGDIFVKSYMLLHDGKLFQEGIFPIGFREQLLVLLGLILSAIVALFLILIGITTFRRKWPVRAWITAVLIGIFLMGSAAAGALAVDAVPRIQQRVEVQQHVTAIKGIQPFKKVVTKGEIDISYVASPDYAANVHYVDHPDLSKLKVYTKDDTLYVDSTELDMTNHCTMLCLFPRYDMVVEIYAPNVEDFKTPARTDIFYPDVPPLPSKTM